MLGEKRLIDLLVQRDCLLEQGKEASPERVCEDCPELIEEFKAELQSFEATDWIFDTDVEEDEDVPPSSSSCATASDPGEFTLPNSSLTLEQFVQAITASEFMSVGEIDSFRETMSGSTSCTESLAREMVLRGKLTLYQASVLLAETSDPLLLDRYVILDKIDSGGMGLVFKARHRSLDRIVALKTLPPSAVDSPDKVRRFRREGEAAAMLTHPNIITTYDAHQSDGISFLVMEYVRGQDLQKTITHEGPLPVATAVDYILQVAQGLEHAHGLGIVHRDIKPGNLLLDTDGTVKILDLGLARFQTFSGLTIPKEAAPESVGVMGTAAYMSPEQAANPHQADHRSDIYSLGCTLHFLLTGHAPYPQDTLVNTVFAHRDKPIPPLDKERKDVPRDLLAVYRRMMAKRREDRYGSMTEVIEALRDCRSVKSDTCQAIEVDRAAPDTTTGRDRTILVKPQSADSASRRRWRNMSAVAALLLATGILGAVIVKIQTSAGTVIVEVDEPGAEICVDDGKVRIVGPQDKHLVEIQVGVGNHTLTVRKDGFQTRKETFTISSGGHQVLRVTLVPLAAGKTNSGKSNAAMSDIADRQPRPQGRRGEPPPLAVAPFDSQQAKEQQQAWAAHLGLPVEWKNSLGMQFVLIPPGEFLMGSSDEEQAVAREKARAGVAWTEGWIPAEGPQHRVQISQPFYLSKHEVTQAQWQTAMGNNPSLFKNPTSPVENVSWHDVQFFLKLNGVEALSAPCIRRSLGASGIRFTLPTEAQWEHACRAGTTSALNSGEREDTLSNHAWFLANAEERTHSVGQLKPNAWGLHDMHGNVWEWCADGFAADYYTAAAQIDPTGPAESVARAFRGGCYGYDACFCRSAFRRGLSPNYRYQSIGFRLAAVLVDQPGK